MKNILQVNTVVQIRCKPWLGCIGYITRITNNCYIVEVSRLGGIAASFDDVEEATEEYIQSDNVLDIPDPQVLLVDINLRIKYEQLERLMKKIEWLEAQKIICEQGGFFKRIEWNSTINV